ncbi:hypothetical protein AMTRI_Chr06g171840 [Amborella trichopoda]
MVSIFCVIFCIGRIACSVLHRLRRSSFIFLGVCTYKCMNSLNVNDISRKGPIFVR